MTSERPPSDHPLAPPVRHSQCVGVPRRFGVGGLMLLVTMCAVLFAVLQTLGAGKALFCVIGVLFVGVAAGQVLLFGGQKPREASLLVGSILFPVEILVLILYTNATSRLNHPAEAVSGMMCSLLAGPVFGYLAGTLTAGIFLVRQQFDKESGEFNDARLRLRPFTEADIDTLIHWTQSHRLFHRWAGNALSYPLDREQVTRHLHGTNGEPPGHHAFLAVCSRTDRPLGYVELRRVAWQWQSARIDRALIAPDESDRDRLCMELLVAAVKTAFEEMNLHRVEAIATAFDATTQNCYMGVGFRVEGKLRDAHEVNGQYRGAYVLGILEGDRLRRPPSI